MFKNKRTMKSCSCTSKKNNNKTNHNNTNHNKTNHTKKRSARHTKNTKALLDLYNPSEDDLTVDDMLLLHLIGHSCKHSKSSTTKMLDSISNSKDKPSKKLIHDLHFIMAVKLPDLVNNIVELENNFAVQSGGVYLKGLEDKGDQPITGNDMAQALDEISGLLTSIQYTPKGSGLVYTNLLVNMLRGDEQSLKDYVKYHEMPKYVSYMPPSINLGAIFNDVDQIPPLYNVYKEYMNSINNYKVSRGELDPKDIKPDYFEKMAQKVVSAKRALRSVDIRNPKQYMQQRMM